jgi:hypothetical protein
MTLGGKTTGALWPHHSLLVGFAGILRGDHRWLDTETDLDLVHEHLDPPAQLIDPFGGVVGLLLYDLRQGHGRTSFTRSRVEVVGRASGDEYPAAH